MRPWTTALVGGLLALAIAFGMCAGLVAWGHRVFPSGDPNAPRRFKQYLPVLEGGAATFYAFQRVPVNLELRESTTEKVNSRFEAPERADARFVVSPIGGLLLVGLALIVGGAVTWKSGKQGTIFGSAARMAIVFALACLGLSFVLPLERTILEPQAFARRSTMLTYVPSHLGAFVWPLVWALIFGSLGMHIARHGRDWRRQLFSPIAARTPDGANALRAALSGLAAGSILVIVAGLATAGVAIAHHPTGAGDILGSGKNVAGIAEGVVLGLPHATGAGLLGSMGVPARFETDVYGSDRATHGSVSIFGGVSRRPHGSESTAVPRYALGGLAIAAIFTVLTGFRAAAGAGGDVRRAIRAALTAAALLTLLLWIIAYLVGARGRLLIGVSELRESNGRIGASPLAVVFLPLVWTIGGGLVGAFLRPRERRTTEVGPRGRSAAKRPALGGAAAALIAVAAGFVVSVGLLDQTPAISPGPAGSNIYRDPTRGWTLQYPDSWHAETISIIQRGGIYTPESHGIFVSNVQGAGDRLEARDIPAGLVAVRVAYDYGGGFILHCDHDTPLPLRLGKAKTVDATLRDTTGAAVKHLRLPFSVQRVALYSVEAWIGSQASKGDLAILDAIVGSVSYHPPPPPSYWEISGCPIEE